MAVGAVPKRSLAVNAAAGLAVSAGLLVIGNLVVGIALDRDDSYDAGIDWFSAGSDLLMPLSFAFMGGLIAVKRPANLVGWALLFASIGMLVGGLLGAYAELALFADPEAELPAGVAAAAVAQGSWTPLMAGVFLLFLLFPNGDVPSRRWRPLVWLVPACFGLVWAAITMSTELDPPFEGLENPIGVISEDALAGVFVVIAFCLVCTAAAGINLLMRFLRSSGEERQQYKWLAFATAVLIAAMPFAALADWENVGGAIFGITLLSLPIAVGIAVLKYRLYEIDWIINRTLVYVPLTAILAGVYVALTALFRALLENTTAANSDAAVAATTIIVVATLTPVKNHLQSIVDRHFKDSRDPTRALDVLAEEARAAAEVLDTNLFIQRFLDTTVNSLSARGAQLSIDDGASRFFRSGSDDVTPALTSSTPLSNGGILSLMIGPRANGRPYTQPEAEALQKSLDSLARLLDASVGSEAPDRLTVHALR